MTTQVATYRLQFRDGMTFDRAVELVPYLQRLGVSHLYASPIFTAVRGSTHGYDVTDHNQIDPEIGGREGFDRLCAALSAAGLGLILDIVPNHMAASLENPWWRSVIELGEASPFARHFDIDWSRPLTLPFLGKPFDEALAQGELAVDVDAEHGCLALRYFDSRYPLHPASYRLVGERLGSAALVRMADCGESEVAGGLRSALAGEDEADLAKRLVALSGEHAFLARLHAAQPWRLTFWKDARKDLSYRRFFEVTGLVGVCVERDEVFDDVHALALELVRAGVVDGLRVDHVDGLAHPGKYLRRLREAVGPQTLLLVEKILGPGERLPVDWPNCGTTGYEFIPAAADLLVDGSGQDALRRSYEGFVGRPVDIEARKREAKLLMLQRNFEGERTRLVAMATEALAAQGEAIAPESIDAALIEIVAGFEVYRSYGEDGPLGPQDRGRVDEAVERALAGGSAELRAIAALATLLVDADSAEAAAFRTRFQQLTGPVMAKAVEDTLFYRVNPLIALNEVGSEPGREAGDVKRFHAEMTARLQEPLGLVATATHDTKRGEDARARLYALSEAAGVWDAAVLRWHEMNAPLRAQAGGAPGRDVEWLLYQMLAGAWPAGEDGRRPADLNALSRRVVPAMEKSLREAKENTDWLSIDAAYEESVLGFTSAVLHPSNADFIDDFDATLRPIIQAGAANALAQTLVKLTSPGIPDIYQGSEGSDFSLVDPDNRRPVDFRGLSEALEQATDIGQAKQRLIAATLRCRSEHPELFATGDYEPVSVTGPSSRHYVAFLRERGDSAALVVVRRLTLGLLGDGVDDAVAALPPRLHGRSFRPVLQGTAFEGLATLPLARLLGSGPAGLWLSD
jgi:(1->4)-alpha-D-glucan 1-alpha-D-glucosylmutase